MVKRYKPVILDVGSNIGYFPLVELKAGAKQIIAVEPISESFNLLRKNLNGYPNVTTLNFALSSRRGMLTLHLSDHYNITSTNAQVIELTGRRIVGKVEVKSETIRSLLHVYGQLEMVRMDVEGYEYTLLKDKLPEQICFLSLELHVIPPYGLKHAARLLKNLEDQGFITLYLIKDVNSSLYPYVKFFGIKPAYLYFKASGESCGVCAENVSPAKITDYLRYPEVVHLIFKR
jgi:FkbM family methyltransferase